MRTLARISERFIWSGISKDVYALVSDYLLLPSVLAFIIIIICRLKHVTSVKNW